MGFNNHAQRSTPPYYLDVDNPFEGKHYPIKHCLIKQATTTTTKNRNKFFSNSVLPQRQEQGVRVKTQTVRHFLDPRGNLCHRECVLVEQDIRSCHTHKRYHLYFEKQNVLKYVVFSFVRVGFRIQTRVDVFISLFWNGLKGFNG